MRPEGGPLYRESGLYSNPPTHGYHVATTISMATTMATKRIKSAVFTPDLSSVIWRYF